MSSGPSCQICEKPLDTDQAYHCMSKHTICAGCTGNPSLMCRLLESNECRLCQREFLDPQHARKEVPPLLNKFSLLKNAVGVTTLFCGVNKYHAVRQVRAKYICTDCEVYSCERCLPHHGREKKGLIGHHNICDLVPNRRHDSTLCWECSHRKATHFCLTDDCVKSLCGVCRSCHDGTHEIKDISVAKDVMEEYIGTQEMALQNGLLYLEEKKMDTERERRGRSRETGLIRDKINSYTDEILRVIDKQRNDLLTELKVNEEDLVHEYDVIEKNLMEAESKKNHLKRIHDLIGDVSNISDVTSAYGFLKSNEKNWRANDVRSLIESCDDVHFKEIIYKNHGDIAQSLMLKHHNLIGEIKTLVGYKPEPLATSTIKCEADTGRVKVSSIILPKLNRVVICDRGNKSVKSSRLNSVNGKHELRDFHLKAQHISQLVHDKKRGRLLGGLCNSWYSWFDEVWVLSWDLFNEKQLCTVGEHHAGLLLVANDDYAYVITAFHTDGRADIIDSTEDIGTHSPGTRGENSPGSRLSPISHRRGDISPKPPSSPRPPSSGCASPIRPSSPSPFSKSAELFPGTLSKKLRRYQLGVTDGNAGPNYSHSNQLSPRLGNSPRNSPLLTRRKRCVTCPSDILEYEVNGDKKELDEASTDVTKRKWKCEIKVFDLETFENVASCKTDYGPKSAVAMPTGELVMVSRDGWMRVMTSGLEELRSVRIAGIRGHREADFHAQTAAVLTVNGRGQLLIGVHGTNATTEKKGGRVHMYSLSGEFLRMLIDEDSGLHRPIAASIDNHGKLFVADDNQDGSQSLLVFPPEQEGSANHNDEKHGCKNDNGHFEI